MNKVDIGKLTKLWFPESKSRYRDQTFQEQLEAVRNKTLQKLMLLHKTVGYRIGEYILFRPLNETMEVLNCSKRTAYDYLNAYLFVLGFK